MWLTASSRSTTRGQALAGLWAGLSAQISAALCSWTAIRIWSEANVLAMVATVEASPWMAASSAAAACGHTLGSARAASLRAVNASP